MCTRANTWESHDIVEQLGSPARTKMCFDRSDDRWSLQYGRTLIFKLLSISEFLKSLWWNIRVRPYWSDHGSSDRSKHIYARAGLPNCSTMSWLSQELALVHLQALCKPQVDPSDSFLMADKNVNIWWKSRNREYQQPTTWHLVIPIIWCQIFLKQHRPFL